MKPVLVLASLLLAVTPVAFGHGDEDHGAPPPAVSQAVSPRAAAASEAFEAVVVVDGKKLLLYLDRYASNDPVAGAKVEIEGGGLNGVAAEAAPGVYAMDAAALTPAKHSLTISIEAGDSVDLLSATLDTTPPQTAVTHVHSWGEWAVWTGAATLALAAGLLLAIRRRRNRKGNK